MSVSDKYIPYMKTVMDIHVLLIRKSSVALFSILCMMVQMFVLAGEGSSFETRYEDIVRFVDSSDSYFSGERAGKLLLYVVKDEYGRFCVEEKQISAVRKLLEKGANPNATDSEGKCALHYVTSYMTDIAGLLVKHGADINARDNEGRTPLMIACENVDVVQIEYLLKLGADGNIKDNKGKVASQYVPVAHPSYVEGESVPIGCMESYELLHSYGYIVDLRGKMALYFILGNFIYDKNTYCSEDELLFLLNHGAETDFLCVFEDKPLRWSMLSFIRSCPQYPDEKIYPMWRGVDEHEQNIRNHKYTTLRRIEEILLEYRTNHD